jgi:hypothetical protein
MAYRRLFHTKRCMQVVCAAENKLGFMRRRWSLSQKNGGDMKEPFALFIWVTSSSVSGVSENVTRSRSIDRTPAAKYGAQRHCPEDRMVK